MSKRPRAQEDNHPPLKKSHWKKRSEDLECSKMGNEPIYRELVLKFFVPFEFEASACTYDPEHNGFKVRLGGEPRKMSLLELGWRVRLYTKRRSRDNATLNRLSRAETIKANSLLMEFCLTIGDDGFIVGNIRVTSIRDPRVKLSHHCIATTITGRKETTHRVTEINLYYLYCIYTPKVVCDILYWLSKYLWRDVCYYDF
nr:hypothetical protein [Tanacetum cinerariifolium]